jgi:hypothetical protein
LKRIKVALEKKLVFKISFISYAAFQNTPGYNVDKAAPEPHNSI